MHKTDIVALGELLVDFAPMAKQSSDFGDWPSLQALPGGAPSNLVATAAKFGLNTSLIGAVGNDYFGKLLSGTLSQAGVNTEHISVIDEAFTTLAFVILDEQGDRDFDFSRKPGADTRLRLSVKQEQIIKDTRCFHFGTLSLTDEPARTSTNRAVALAQEAGVWINFDPNYRAPLWRDKESARKAILWGFSQSDSIKVCKDELLFAFNSNDVISCQQKLIQNFNVKLVLITDGANGSYYWSNKANGHVAAHLLENTVDTTGAGDIFTGSVLSQILIREESISQAVATWSDEIWREVISLSNKFAAISTTRFGGISSIPDPSKL